MLAPGDEPPGRWVLDGKNGKFRVGQGVMEWRTQHGPAIAQWNLGRVTYIWNAFLPDGSRADVSGAWPALDTFRRAVNDTYEHGAIEVRANDVVFTPIDLPQLDVKDDVQGLFNILAQDEAFMRDVVDIALAHALYSVLENASFMHGGALYEFGQRSAAHFVAALRRNGETYLDFAWSGSAVIADLEKIRAHFHRLAILAAHS